MEIPEILDNMDISADKEVLEVLKQAIGDESVIFETEAEGTSGNSEEGEIEEIIEIIEEVEEEDESSQNSEKTNTLDTNDGESTHVEITKRNNYTIEDDSSVFKLEQPKRNSVKRVCEEISVSNKKQVVTYDVDEDWQDEEMEQVEELDDGPELNSELTIQRVEPLEQQGTLSGNKKSVNKQIITFPSRATRVESRTTAKSKVGQEFGSSANNAKNVDNNVGHEIVKNVENNLLYTVLGSKKSVSSAKAVQSGAHYVKMEQYTDNTIPVDGTIYYEGDNMETLYVAQSVEDNEQYQYDSTSIDQDEQTWDVANSDTTQNQEEENSQDQIFLHEDEDGQLYFKDDSGALQPVYLTEDGNYAIAENSDDQEPKESQGRSQAGRSSESSTFILPDTEPKSTHSSKQNLATPSTTINDLDNEDNTVTISLIISEDEHGQKRTQVIIPTSDNPKCDICNKTFKTSFQLLRHNRLKHAREEDITTRNFPCDLCPKRYPDQNSLARHRKTHTGDRPFQCLECHKNFPTSTALRRHLTLHNSQSRPLPCIYCGRRFMEKESLAKHEQSHLAGDQRTHTCDICHKSFSNATDLSLHKKYHDPDKKFDCEVCGRQFNRLNNLQRHMMVHQQQGANEEILACDVCGITYKFMSSLTRHMVTTHMNPEKLRQQAEEQRKKRENNYRRYLENRKMYETQHSGGYSAKRNYHPSSRVHGNNSDDAA